MSRLCIVYGGFKLIYHYDVIQEEGYLTKFKRYTLLYSKNQFNGYKEEKVYLLVHIRY